MGLLDTLSTVSITGSYCAWLYTGSEGFVNILTAANSLHTAALIPCYSLIILSDKAKAEVAKRQEKGARFVVSMVLPAAQMAVAFHMLYSGLLFNGSALLATMVMGITAITLAINYQKEQAA